MTDTANHAAEIAASFVDGLKEFMTVEQWEEMRAKNATPRYAGNVCASHDYCDANTVMAPAFLDVMRREIDLQSEADLALWGEAWAIAKRDHLTAPVPLSLALTMSNGFAWSDPEPTEFATYWAALNTAIAARGCGDPATWLEADAMFYKSPRLTPEAVAVIFHIDGGREPETLRSLLVSLRREAGDWAEQLCGERDGLDELLVRIDAALKA
jgi:hypothetical protein